ncbi:MAG: CHAT domain-containing protein [Acetobacteraceae bacterium]|nr:CHAT domain-containing protein [Acetobacteraceae bacterium]
MLRFRHSLVAALLAVGLAACSTPPDSAYVSGGQSSKAEGGLALGKNATGEDCTQQGLGEGADVYCGTWLQPSARIRRPPPGSPASAAAMATDGPWRTALDQRFACQPAIPTTILGSEPALLLQCTRRVGGWAHVALVATVGGTTWLADGVQPSLPVMERAIGVLSGRLPATAAATETLGGAAQRLLAERAAARAFSSGDVGEYDRLVRVADDSNRIEDFSGSEKNLRAALALQQKAIGADNPNTVVSLIGLALQVSNQRRYAEADALFARAEQMVGTADDPIQAIRLVHYKALHAANQGHPEQALPLLARAGRGYADLLPDEVRNARPRAAARIGSSGSGSGMAELLPNREMLSAPTTRTALLGLIEVHRREASMLRQLGRLDESLAALRLASNLISGNGLRQPIITARMARTSAGVVAATEGAAASVDDYARAVAVFAQALPDSRPVAETLLLRAGQIVRAGQAGDADEVCLRAVRLLRQLRIGADPQLIAPCLDSFAAAARANSGDSQKWLVEMFEAAQLAQGGITSQQIAQATARLSENARDPKVAEAIRAREDIRSRLTDLYRERDQLEPAAKGGGNTPSTSPELDARIAKAQEEAAEADSTLQAASPNYGQLVQQVAPAADVLAALAPGEAFVSLTLSDTGGWAFALRAGRVAVAPIPGGLPEMTKLVRRVRGSIENTTGTPPPFDIEAAQAIYRATLAGLEPALQGADAMVIVPAGPLLSLPFELLLTGPATQDALATAPWLLRRAAISHVPAAANFVSLRKIAGNSRATHPWFGFGDFRPVTLAQAMRTFGPECADSARLYASLPPLPYARAELDASRRLLGASASDMLLGPAFTAPAVKQAKLKDFRILHFATHALLPAELRCQAEPAIVTSAPAGAANAAGSLLTASAVLELDLDADTVILSACNSGGPGGSTAGESLSGLARSFFYAGARSLLVTHWSVNDQIAAYLVADSLRRLGATPAIGITGAMRAAQLGMLDEAGKGLVADVAHPFYWAPFAVIGEGGARRGGQQAAVSISAPTGL